MPDQKRVLVIEDDEEFLNILTHYLSGAGYQVDKADTGEDGLEKLAKEIPDLVLLDLMLPGMDGYEVLAKIRGDERTRKTPLILITVQSKVSEIAKGLRLGANDYILKPFKPEQFLGRVASLLE